MLKHKYTNRKFYNKYMFKISMNMPGVSIYRMKTLEQTIAELNSNEPYKGLVTDTVTKAFKNKSNLTKLSLFLINLQGDYIKRIERDTIDFYTNDENVHKSFCDTFSAVIKTSYTPPAEYIEALDSNKYIICKKLPHNKYKFKVYLLPHKLKHNKEDKIKYVNWLEKQKTVHISPLTKKWFILTDWYWDRRYVYAEDEKSLILMQMRNPNVIGRVYEYLVSDK